MQIVKGLADEMPHRQVCWQDPYISLLEGSCLPQCSRALLPACNMDVSNEMMLESRHIDIYACTDRRFALYASIPVSRSGSCKDTEAGF